MLLNNVSWARVMTGLLVLLGSGCATGGPEQGDAITADQGPDELELNGHHYVRRWMLSELEVAEMTDPALWQPPETVDKLAQLLRGNIVHAEYGEYVEAEPNYALARISLGQAGALKADSEPLNPEDAVAVKTISTDGDGRTKIGFTNQLSLPPFASALFESGGTGTMVNWRVYTAAHVLFNNPIIGGLDGWNCRNGTKDPSGACTAAGQPRWRFGGEIVNGTPTFTTSWLLCGYKNVSTGWAGLPSNSTSETMARWDYGFQNLDGCIPSTGVSSVGSWGPSQSTLRTLSLYSYGYPGLYKCPALTGGLPGDCPVAAGGQGIIQLLPDFVTRPYTGASLFRTSATNDTALVQTGGYIKTGKLDFTVGQSGASLLVVSNGSWFAVGANSNTVVGTSFSWFNYMTVEVQNFILM